MAFLLEEIESAYNKDQLMSPKKYVKAKIYHGGKGYDLTKRCLPYHIDHVRLPDSFVQML